MKKIKLKVYNSSPFELPSYKTIMSAGMDVRANLSNVYDLKIQGDFSCDDEKQTLTLKPLSRAIIPTGLHIAIPEGYEVQLRPRSGLAIKDGITLLNTPGTIDADYRGEIGVIIANISNKDVVISHEDRIAQLVIKEQPQIEWDEVSSLDDLGNTDRGNGGFGHTGKK